MTPDPSWREALSQQAVSWIVAGGLMAVISLLVGLGRYRNTRGKDLMQDKTRDIGCDTGRDTGPRKS